MRECRDDEVASLCTVHRNAADFEGVVLPDHVDPLERTGGVDMSWPKTLGGTHDALRQARAEHADVHAIGKFGAKALCQRQKRIRGGRVTGQPGHLIPEVALPRREDEAARAFGIERGPGEDACSVPSCNHIHFEQPAPVLLGVVEQRLVNGRPHVAKHEIGLVWVRSRLGAFALPPST